MTTFLEPTTAIVFKKLFGEQDRSPLLISLLNNLLELPTGEHIESLSFNEPDTETVTLDVTCTDKQGKQCIVVLQINADSDVQEQCQFIAAQALARQLKKKAATGALAPIACITLADSRIFSQDSRYSRTYRLIDAQAPDARLQHTSFVFIELPKFTKALDELSSPIDRWLYFFKHAASLEAAPKQLEKVSEIKEACQLLTEMKLTRKELDAYEAEVKLRRITQAQQEAEELARRQGMQDAQRKLIEQMLTALPMEQVADITKLSIEQIQGLLV
ncbi:Rpn family recombination-promoting nuclease/putative transposase [Candidatus Dependentiae bacterium]|nr:Rpn family recombination-promoting nuclease/putative transposase [Candidatus Dependentiae bacterium]